MTVKSVRGRWLAVGIVLGALLVPATAFGIHEATKVSGSPVTVYGPGGRPVNISPAGQFQVAETNPANFTVWKGLSNSFCVLLGTVPNDRAFIIKQVNFVTVYGDVQLRASADCSGEAFVESDSATNSAQGGLYVVPLTPGFAIPAGGSVSVAPVQSSGPIYIYGYYVPSYAVPAVTPVEVRP